MRARAWCLAAVAACSLTGVAAYPARAGWGMVVSRMVVDSLVRQAVNKMAQRSYYQPHRYVAPASPQQEVPPPAADYSYGNYQRPTPPVHHTTTATHHQHTTAGNSSMHYPTDHQFIPPPPPYPEVYPAGPDTSISTSASKYSRGMSLVPPPPPAPSVWDDLTPASETSIGPSDKVTGGSTAEKNDAPKKYFDDEKEPTSTAPKPAPDVRGHKVASHAGTTRSGT